jgi:hypothetical protein
MSIDTQSLARPQTSRARERRETYWLRIGFMALNALLWVGIITAVRALIH